MVGIQRLREMYPQYANKSDGELARAYHRTAYGDMPWEQFAQEFIAASQRPARGRVRSGERGRQGGGSQREAKKAGGYSPELMREMANNGYMYVKELDGFYPFDIVDGKPVIKDDKSLRASRDLITETERKLAAMKDGSYDSKDPQGLRSEGGQSEGQYDFNPRIGRAGIGAGTERNPVMELTRERDRQEIEQYESDYPQGLPEEYYHAPGMGVNGASGYYQAMRGGSPQSYEGEILYPEGAPVRWRRENSAPAPAAAQAAAQAERDQPLDIGYNSLPAEMGKFREDASRGLRWLGEGIEGAIGWIKGNQEPIELEPDYTRDFRR